MQIGLDDIWQWPSELPCVAIDLRVSLHQLLPSYIKASQQMLDGKNEQWLETATEAIWQLFLSKPMPAYGKPAQIIVCDDYKSIAGKYWRSEHYAPYKANRTAEADRDSSYGFMLKQAYACIEKLNLPMLRQESFEADCMFGMLAKLWPGDRTLLMRTCDQDISQLVDDKKQILFYNSMQNKPRLRSEYEVLWHYNRFGTCITKPAEIAQHKQIAGDSDNIAPCSAPLGIIDLHAPLLSPDEPQWLRSWLAEPIANNSEPAYKSARAWLLRNGLGAILDLSANW